MQGMLPEVRGEGLLGKTWRKWRIDKGEDPPGGAGRGSHYSWGVLGDVLSNLSKKKRGELEDWKREDGT